MPSLAVVPAAGKAQRFGGGKLIADVGGEPLLDRTLACLIDAGVDRIVVVLGPQGQFETVRRLADPRVLIAVNPDPARGMFSSIQTGFDADEGDPILILPGDMPFVASATVHAVLERARAGSLVVPCHRGKRGHPIGVPGRLRATILAANPGYRLKDVLEASGVPRVELDVADAGILRDVDVPGDLGDPGSHLVS